MRIKLTIYTCLFLILIGCQSDHLNRTQVENELKEYLKSNIKKSNLITIHGVVRKSEIDDNRQFLQEYSTLKPYLDAGLLFKEKEEYRPETRKIWITYTLTKKGKAYLVNEEARDAGNYPIFNVKCYDIIFGGISGIKEINPNQSVVEFFIKKTNITPFGKLQEYQQDEVKLYANYTKYDNGWRLMEISDQDTSN